VLDEGPYKCSSVILSHEFVTCIPKCNTLATILIKFYDHMSQRHWVPWTNKQGNPVVEDLSDASAM